MSGCFMVRLSDASSVLLEPALQLAHRDQPPATAADDARLGHHVLLEEVDADAEGVRRLALREREATERGADRLFAPVLDRAARGGRATTSRGTSTPRGRTVIRALGEVRTPTRRS